MSFNLGESSFQSLSPFRHLPRLKPFKLRLTSYEPNLMADSGMILTTLRPLPGGESACFLLIIDIK